MIFQDVWEYVRVMNSKVVYTYVDEEDTSSLARNTLQVFFLLLPFHDQKLWLRKKFLDDEQFMEYLKKGKFLEDEKLKKVFKEGKDKYFVVSKKRLFLNMESVRTILKVTMGFFYYYKKIVLIFNFVWYSILQNIIEKNVSYKSMTYLTSHS